MGPGKGEICVLIRKRRSGAESREKRGEGDDEGEGPEKPPTRELDDATIYESTIRATTRSREKPPTTTRVLSLNLKPPFGVGVPQGALRHQAARRRREKPQSS